MINAEQARAIATAANEENGLPDGFERLMERIRNRAERGDFSINVTTITQRAIDELEKRKFTISNQVANGNKFDCTVGWGA